MDFTEVVVVVLALVGLAWVVRPLWRRLPVHASASTPEAAIEEARAAGLKLDWTEIDVDQLEANRAFQRHVTRMSESDIPFPEVAQLAQSGSPGIAALGLYAIAKRDDIPEKWISNTIRGLPSCPYFLEPLVYRVLLEREPKPVIGRVLGKLSEEMDWDAMARFVQERRARGETVDVGTFRGNVPPAQAETLEAFINRFETYLGDDFRGYYEEWRRTAVDLEFLEQVGRILQRPYDDPPAYLAGRRQELVEVIVDALGDQPRRSLLLVGEHGVGKTTLLRAALERLPPQLIPFEATAAEINAGAMYVGELEGRIRDLATRLEGHPVIWIIPGFSEVLYAGQHSRSPSGMLDAMLPHIERRALTVVGELDPTSYERLLAERPRIAGAFEVVRVRPLDEQSTVAAAEQTVEGRASRETLLETYELAHQFLPGLAAPGNLLRLVKATAADVEEEGRREFETSDVLATLAASSGLPLAMLDPSAPLDMEQVRAFFEGRVLAQPEAVTCVVERIAMIKAGLNDPSRPLGVFLFIGPTGTGKTEIAKALAEYLFGSPRRLVRLDMSEFQTPDAHDRLLQDPSVESRGSVLLSSVRKDPFAVILLDEFEKAAPPIWDLFLQVFDDGRLTDQQGRTADFRRSIIILTSNVGSALAHRPGLGFKAEHGRFRSELIQDELKRTFRPEFLNRIDQVVVFRPFERAEVRELLEKELAEALDRRGLRTRPWAIELDESAIDFLIEQGFSPTLGARPLKRAIERYLLSAIAKPIVEQAVPEGDQFLLVSVGTGRLDVTFVDPDAAEEPARDADAESAAALDLRSLALREHADRRAAEFLLDELARIRSVVEGYVRNRKAADLAAMQSPAFWEDEDRHEVLAEVEYLDRLEAAFATAAKLGERLSRHATRARNGTGELAAILALRLHVLDAAVSGLDAGRRRDVFLRVRAAGSDGGPTAARWAELLGEMYSGWARRRGMRLDRLNGGDHLYLVSGLGAEMLLEGEAGLHVLEVPEEGREDGRADRIHAIVDVVAAPVVPAADTEAPAARARSLLAGLSTPETVVRRYREEPAPLVRDSVRGYRTGRIDRVLAGDFDLF
jgi:ATP-dependent Clp protease ATP-binding subunit ClpC